MNQDIWSSFLLFICRFQILVPLGFLSGLVSIKVRSTCLALERVRNAGCSESLTGLPSPFSLALLFSPEVDFFFFFLFLFSSRVIQLVLSSDLFVRQHSPWTPYLFPFFATQLCKNASLRWVRRSGLFWMNHQLI